MRDRKLSDQTLPVKAAGTLVSPSGESYDLATAKSRNFSQPSSTILPSECGCSNLFANVYVAPKTSIAGQTPVV